MTKPSAQEKGSACVGSTSLQPQKSGQTLFRVVWRWHFYAGIIVSPFLLVVALTGGIFLFGAEVVDIANKESLFVEQIGATVPYETLIQSAQTAIPGGKATRLQIFADPWRTVEVTVQPSAGESGEEKQQRRSKTVYVDPYTSSVVAMPDGPARFSGLFRLVLKIHRELFISTTGRIVTELVTTWTILLLISGVYLWWPRRKEKVQGVWVPRWTAKSYTLLRDMHALMGIYLLPICLTILITGLFYTLVWGESFHLATDPFFPDLELAETNQQETTAKDAKPMADNPPRFMLQQVIEQTKALYPERDITITLPDQPTSHYQVSAINDYARGTFGAMNSTGFKIHRDTGKLLEVNDLWQHNRRYWWHSWAYPLHVGSVLGMTSKIVWLAACMVLIAMPFTGLWMWWKRRPKGQSGFPRSQSLGVVPTWVWIAIAVLAVLLPVFGISIVVIIAGDWLLRTLSRRVQSDTERR